MSQVNERAPSDAGKVLFANYTVGDDKLLSEGFVRGHTIPQVTARLIRVNDNHVIHSDVLNSVQSSPTHWKIDWPGLGLQNDGRYVLEIFLNGTEVALDFAPVSLA